MATHEFVYDIKGPERVTDVFSKEEIEASLQLLEPEDRALVLGSLAAQSEARQRAEQKKVLHSNMFYFAATYERCIAPHASSTNMEGWYEQYEDSAYTLLEDLGAQGGPDGEAEQAAAHLAAVTVLALYGDRYDTFSRDGLARAGVDETAILHIFRGGLDVTLQALGIDMRDYQRQLDEFDANVTSYEALLLFKRNQPWAPAFWGHVQATLGLPMRRAMENEDYKLPALEANGTYGYDEFDIEVMPESTSPSA